MLKELHLKLVGPAPQFGVKFADRLNIFTGDNGLGKSFLLDVAWWALTGNSADNSAWPQRVEGETLEITFYLSEQRDSKEYRSPFSFSKQKWLSQQKPIRFGQGLLVRM